MNDIFTPDLAIWLSRGTLVILGAVLVSLLIGHTRAAHWLDRAHRHK